MTTNINNLNRSTYKGKKALLIGNGINQLDTSQSFSWGQLLTELKRKFSINVDLDNVFKPFPLAFDEMLHQKSGENEFKNKLRTLKKNISRSIASQLEGKRGFNEYHQRIMELNYDDILTTNYDYSLEKSVEQDFFQKKRSLALNRQELKYSLKRRYSLPQRETVVWHIHGEQVDSRRYRNDSENYPEMSILIGYEHYADYLQKIQENVIGVSGVQKIENQSLKVRLRNKIKSPFWTDIFFTHNLDIVGQGCDFSENHLWWLINYRANLMRDTSTEKDFVVNNRIRFYYPVIEDLNRFELSDLKDMERVIRKKNNVDKSKAISELLKAFHVITVPIYCKSFLEFYDIFISRHLSK